MLAVFMDYILKKLEEKKNNVLPKKESDNFLNNKDNPKEQVKKK